VFNSLEFYTATFRITLPWVLPFALSFCACLASLMARARAGTPDIRRTRVDVKPTSDGADKVLPYRSARLPHFCWSKASILTVWLNVGDEPRPSLIREVSPRPINQHEYAIAEPDKQY